MTIKRVPKVFASTARPMTVNTIKQMSPRAMPTDIAIAALVPLAIDVVTTAAHPGPGVAASRVNART
jgi:hypothetical protein